MWTNLQQPRFPKGANFRLTKKLYWKLTYLCNTFFPSSLQINR